MIHLLTFQSINNVLYFFNLGGYRDPTPTLKKFGGGVKMM